MRHIFLFTLAAALLAAVPGWAQESLTVQNYIEVTDDSGHVVARAYGVQNGCRNWYYIPTQLVTSGKFSHTTRTSIARYGDLRKVVLVTDLNLSAAPKYDSKHERILKEKIAGHLSKLERCKSENISARDILLNSAQVKMTYMAKENTSDQEEQEYSSTFVSNMSRDPKASHNPTLPISIVHRMDGSAPTSLDRLSELRDISALRPVRVGEVHYVINGIVGRIRSELKMTSDMTADFVSSVEKIKCTTGKEKGSSSLAYLAAGSLAGLLGKTNSEKETCDFQLLTNFAGGDIKTKLGIRHYGDLNELDGKPKMITPCDEKGICSSKVSLEQYATQKLIEYLLLANFEQIQTRLTDNTFIVSLGRRGRTKTDMRFEIDSERDYYNNELITVPIYAERLDPHSFNLGFAKGAFYQCVTGQYESQKLKYVELVASRPVPISEDCLRLDGGAQ
ncbi:MAG: hypothetical protein HC883_01550 [Bdellovibrionaceae bacterium]|nr:hypothetical protein [Pseudobdellovibrionaceae bacterium]